MNSTEQCQVQASWRQLGTHVYRQPKFVYRIPCTPGSRMVEHLGAVKRRTDGRWDWWRFESKYHQWNGEGQGVAANQGAAEIQVLEGWDVKER